MKVLCLTVAIFLGLRCSSEAVLGADVVAANGFKVTPGLSHPGLESFTWDETGALWILSSAGNRLTISSVSGEGEVAPLRSIERTGNGQSSLLSSGERFFVADGPAIHSVSRNASQPTASYFPPRNLFPANLEMSSLAWGPLGEVHFLFSSSVRQERGIGRVSPQGTEWDVVAKGSFGSFGFDLDGFMIAADAPSGAVFRVAQGLDYDRGLETYQKRDLALRTDASDLRAGFALIHSGAAWPEENRGTWLIHNETSGEIEQLKEQDGKLLRWRTALRLPKTDAIRAMQMGPDGHVWLLAAPRSRQEGQRGVIYRLESGEETVAKSQPELGGLNSEELVAELGSLNSWRRDAALRLLDAREDLRNIRSLHPSLPMKDAFSDKTNSPTKRAFAMISLHRLGLLDETLLENAADDEELLVRVWAGLLLGERNYPTQVTFHKLMKLAKETNLVARSAAAVGARRFVSGSLAIDTAPRAMPIHEVFTGGILSTLWFSTEKGSSPEFDLLFWNAVRPITAFDHEHPMGFFNGDNDEKLELAHWIIVLITRQIAESDDPLLQERAMMMVGELKPKNRRLILGALNGLKGADRKVTPTNKSMKVLADFSKSEDSAIAALAEEIRLEWMKPFR